ncbi:MAG: hypothetical protein HUJ68_07545 [Clostridia bacterium]|nr:hypothetical protein [Clostridia bacterium]
MKKKNQFSIDRIVKIFNSNKKTKDSGTSSANLLIKGKFSTCIILSIVSAFIDIVFFSGLSRSDYPFFKWSLEAAIVLSIMSIGFSFGKFFVAMQLSAIKEIQTRLKQMGYSWYKNFKSAHLKWSIVHKFLISISVITSISLSTITIGNGVRTMEMNIKNMSEDANYLKSLKTDQKSSNSDKKDLIVGAATSNIDNERKAAEEAEAAKKYLNEYKAKRDLLDEESETYEEDKKALVNKYVKLIPMVSSKNIDYTTAIDIENYFKKQMSNNSSANNSLKSYEEILEFNKNEIESTITGLVAKEYKLPSGELVSFLKDDGTPVELDIAIGRLEQAIMAWQVDTGDAGPSSKVFQLLATYIKADTTAGGMGFSEIIMMILVCVFGIVQEYLIAIFTPKSIISRKMIFHFTEYMGDGFDPNLFMLQTYKEYLDSGVMSTETFNEKAKKCVEQMESSVDDIIAKFSKKKKLSDNGVNIDTSKLENAISKAKEVL